MDIGSAKIERISHVVDKKDTRFYKFDEQVGLSVSSACSVITPYYLQNWYKKNSANKINKRLEETAGQGTEGHSLIEQQAEGKEVEPKEELKEWFSEWNKTQKQYEISAEMSEIMVFSKTFAYGGQIDRVGMFQGKRCIIDFKTGSYSHMNLWKTEAYRQAYIEMTGDEVGAVVLHLPRPDLMERGHKVRHYTIDRHTTCFLNFLSAYQCMRMLYYKDLLKAGMSSKDVFAPHSFWLYEREHGTGSAA